MKYSEAKWILEEFDGDRTIIENIENGETNFYSNDDCYRFIQSDNIDDVMRDELLCDEYLLGGFNASFISEITGLDVSVIEKGQSADNYELLGALMALHIEEVIDLYVSYDGYGHHFASYDGDENEVTINGNLWYYFKVN